MSAWLFFPKQSTAVASAALYWLQSPTLADSVDLWLQNDGQRQVIATIPKRAAISISGSEGGGNRSIIGHLNIRRSSTIADGESVDDTRTAYSRTQEVQSNYTLEVAGDVDRPPPGNSRHVASLFIDGGRVELISRNQAGAQFDTGILVVAGSSPALIDVFSSASAYFSASFWADNVQLQVDDSDASGSASISSVSNMVRVGYLIKTANDCVFALKHSQASSNSPFPLESNGVPPAYEEIVYGVPANVQQVQRPSFPTQETSDGLYSDLNYSAFPFNLHRNFLPDGRTITLFDPSPLLGGSGQASVNISISEPGQPTESRAVDVDVLPADANILHVSVFAT